MSSDDDELFTEEDDDDYQPSGRKEFSLYHPLDPPNPKPWSIGDLHVQMHLGLIDLEAPYQRDIVWPDAKQTQLIDSIFRNFYVPPVIFAIRIDPESGCEIRVCVDGKQRLTSISKFMDGQIPHRDPRTKKAYWFTRGNSKTSRTELPEAWKKKFTNKQITCIEYTNLKPGDERDLFQRVQLGMPLTPAEKLQAYESPITEWIRSLQQRFIDVDDGLQHNLRWNVARGRNFLGMAQLCFCCWHLPQYGFPANSKLLKWFASAPVPSKTFEKQMQSVLQSYVHISQTEKYQRGFAEVKERVAPVEFVMIGVLLAKMQKCTWDDRAEQILALRKHVRGLHKDIRGNERVAKSMWIFIEEISIRDATFDDWEGPEEGSKKSTTARKTTQVRKRPREDVGDSRDKPGPSKRTGVVVIAEPKTKGMKTLSTRTDNNGVRFVA